MNASTRLKELGVGSSGWHWFGRGFLVGVMILAAANATSYFFRSDGVSNLIGLTRDQNERIGFPLEVWQRGKSYGRYVVNFNAFFINALVGASLGVLLGGLATTRRTWLNRMLLQGIQNDPAFADRPEVERSVNSPAITSDVGAAQEPTSDIRTNQFSMGGLLLCTAMVAGVIAAAMKIGPDPKVLAAVYFFAPVVTVVVAMVPPNFSWQIRCVVLLALCATAIGVAISVGGGLGFQFDEVLMGIFICWTPQGVVGALALLTWLIFKSEKGFNA